MHQAHRKTSQATSSCGITFRGRNLCPPLACADDDSTEAMNTFIHRLLGTKSTDELRRVSSQNSAVELSEILLFCITFGFLLRALEMKYLLQSVDDWDDGLPGLLAGL